MCYNFNAAVVYVTTITEMMGDYEMKCKKLLSLLVALVVLVYPSSLAIAGSNSASGSCGGYGMGGTSTCWYNNGLGGGTGKTLFATVGYVKVIIYYRYLSVYGNTRVTHLDTCQAVKQNSGIVSVTAYKPIDEPANNLFYYSVDTQGIHEVRYEGSITAVSTHSYP